MAKQPVICVHPHNHSARQCWDCRIAERRMLAKQNVGCPRVLRPVFERFWRNVREDPETGCWVWAGGLRQVSGYGNIFLFGKATPAHRYSYREWVGAIPSWLEMDHLCRNRACVNPNHLEAVTRSQNWLRGVGPERALAYLRGRTHCCHGHEYTNENTHWYHRQRRCRICSNAQSHKYYEETRSKSR